MPRDLHGAAVGFIEDDLVAVRQVFDPTINAAFADGAAARWIARDGAGRPLGRIAAFGRRGRAVAGFGFFACIDDPAVSTALFEAADGFARALGAERLEGPGNFGERDRFCGLVVDGFAEPLPLETHNPPYYAALVEAAEFTPSFESLTFRLDLDALPRERLARTARADLVCRVLTPADGERFVGDVLAVYHSAFEASTRIKPLEAAELSRRAALAAPTTAASEVMLAYRGEEPLGFLAWLSDARRGVKVYGLAVKPEARLAGVEAALVLAALECLAARGHREVHVAGVARYSQRVVRFLQEVLGGRCERVHMTYRKDLDRDVR